MEMSPDICSKLFGSGNVSEEKTNNCHEIMALKRESFAKFFRKIIHAQKVLCSTGNKNEHISWDHIEKLIK